MYHLFAVPYLGSGGEGHILYRLIEFDMGFLGCRIVSEGVFMLSSDVNVYISSVIN